MKEESVKGAKEFNIRSMTGFGRGEAVWNGRTVIVEVRTVNNRYLDVRCRLPDGWMGVESKLVSLASTFFKRGRVDVSVRLGATTDVDGARRTIRIDVPAVHALKEFLDELTVTMGITSGVDWGVLSQYRDLFVLHPSLTMDTEDIWVQVQGGVKAAFARCHGERVREGVALGRVIKSMVDESMGAVALLDREKDLVVEAGRQRFADRIAQLLQGGSTPEGGARGGVTTDDPRVVAEAAVLAERYDVSEEVARLQVHLEELSRLVHRGGGEGAPVGRRLDFLLQELMREANTCGAKIGFPRLSSVVVELRSVLERIREQVQNIE